MFAVQPEQAVAGDINRPLILTYEKVRDNPVWVSAILDDMDKNLCAGGEGYYKSMRDLYNDKLIKQEYDMELAALFIFLNKHCFNGLYRVNKKGLFNVPYNKSTAPSVNPDNIRKCSEYLANVILMHGDFEQTLDTAGKGDFVFLDSPYVPLKADSFTSYTRYGFGEESHRRLAWVFEDLTGRGCSCLLTNHDTPLVRELYGKYHIETVDAKRMINSDPSGRTGKEVIITNY